MKSVIKQFRAPEKETFNGFMVCILFALFILYFIQFLVLYFAVGTKKDYLDMQGREKKKFILDTIIFFVRNKSICLDLICLCTL